ncbi:N-acylneuraminate cytidylyltransferase [Lutibacter sp. Hel_I_33_5]|uniref:acylneuraminate cytidylyltransferase family protein n=1 Tax=Lutibacter sp. Hel_I_33_5 TaxID=1566289 RepID=UPI00119E2571|nr:acylneuraminate cytidylyltransferase family protein [Lutibacter sp. Hel_I_33_5]TVZ54862.1 N-acylneuraminate cytidylyltransferase [Lutibacter sp. Hel_I_33_5]
MKILGLIPARGGSKGVPYKNIKKLNGKPLLQYTSEIALKSKYLSKVILTTDDDKIMKVGKQLNLEVPFKRPAELALDASPTLSVILHTLEYYESKNVFFDAVCLLQVTSPFRTLQFLNNAIEKFIVKETDSLISVLEIPHEYNPHWSFEVNSSGNLDIATGESEIISRRQELPKAYHRDGSIYITKTTVIKNQKSLYGKTIAYIESPKSLYVNIDTIEDWYKAEDMAILLNK